METFMAIANAITLFILFFILMGVIMYALVFLVFCCSFGIKNTFKLYKKDYHLEFGNEYDTDMIEKEDKENE